MPTNVRRIWCCSCHQIWDAFDATKYECHYQQICYRQCHRIWDVSLLPNTKLLLPPNWRSFDAAKCEATPPLLPNSRRFWCRRIQCCHCNQIWYAFDATKSKTLLMTSNMMLLLLSNPSSFWRCRILDAFDATYFEQPNTKPLLSPLPPNPRLYWWCRVWCPPLSRDYWALDILRNYWHQCGPIIWQIVSCFHKTINHWRFWCYSMPKNPMPPNPLLPDLTQCYCYRR